MYILQEMSRLIIKNLPKTLEKDKLAELFAAYGDLTDVKVCKKKSGESRRFGFVGFKSEADAARALKYFNKSYINTSKVEVDFAKNIGDPSVPRPWSKYSSKSSEFERYSKEKTERRERIRQLQETKLPEKNENYSKEGENQKGGNQINSQSDDVGFYEFVEAHQKPSVKKTWTNELVDSKQQEHNTRGNTSGSDKKKDRLHLSKIKKVLLTCLILIFLLLFVGNGLFF